MKLKASELASMFSPFEDWDDEGKHEFFALCMKNGKRFDPPEGDENYTEWHVWYMGGDIWEVSYAPSPACETLVYRGKIPNREFFVDLMRNVECGMDVINVLIASK